MKITKELLLEKGWKLEKPIINMSKYEALAKIEGYKPSEDYEYIAVNSNQKYFTIEMRYDMSNTPNRDWGCHIDNSLCESIAFVDIGTVEQFNKLMELMDIEYRL